MFKRILIATDGSELSRHAVISGLEFAASIHASAILAHITAPYEAMLLLSYPLPAGFLPAIEEHRRICKAGADNLLVPALALAKEKGVSAACVAIEHHIEAFGSDPRNAILLSGFQAGGTRGALLASGVQSLRMYGKEVPIRAEIVQPQSLSSHADGDEIIDWLRPQQTAPEMTYITHGEPDASDILRGRIKHELVWNCRVPEQLQRIDLTAPK